MKEKILAKVEESFLKAEAYYGRTFPRPNVIFKRNGTCAGYATRDCKTLMFQLDLAEHHEEDFILNTVPHEVAHNIQFHLYPRSKGHGYEWKSIMTRVMRIPADRCHSYDTSVTKTKKQGTHTYTCGCNTIFNLSTTLHNKILKGQNRRCLKCHSRIFLKSDTAESLLKQMEEIQNKLNNKKVS